MSLFNIELNRIKFSWSSNYFIYEIKREVCTWVKVSCLPLLCHKEKSIVDHHIYYFQWPVRLFKGFLIKMTTYVTQEVALKPKIEFLNYHVKNSFPFSSMQWIYLEFCQCPSLHIIYFDYSTIKQVCHVRCLTVPPSILLLSKPVKCNSPKQNACNNFLLWEKQYICPDFDSTSSTFCLFDILKYFFWMLVHVWNKKVMFVTK